MMAIVKTETVFVDGSPFIKKVKCSANGVFSCELPDYVAKDLALDVKHQTPSGDSLSDCLCKWSDKIREYENRTTTESKVICFAFEKDISFAKGLSLSVCARVKIENTTTHRDGHKVYSYDDCDDDDELPHRLTHGFQPGFRGEHYENQIPWTPEAELFFVDLAKAMEKLIEKLESISTSPKTMLDFINTGIKLLPGKTK